MWPVTPLLDRTCLIVPLWSILFGLEAILPGRWPSYASSGAVSYCVARASSFPVFVVSPDFNLREKYS